MQHRSATNTPTLVIIFTFIISLLTPFNYLAWGRDVTLGWDPNKESDLLGYYVYMGEQPDSYGPFMDAEDKSTYTIQNLDDNKTYYFAVSAYDTNGNEGDPSTEVMLLAVDDTTPPTTPGGLNASVLSSTQIKLIWDPATDNVGVTNYKIYRDGNLIKTKSSTLSQQYTNKNLTPNTLYTYMVTAVDEAGNESNPADTSAKTVTAGDTTPPSTPGNLVATPGSPTQITLNWNASSDDVGVAEYQVKRDGDLLVTTSNTNFSNTNLTPDTLYSYAVIALDEAGNASTPAEASATTDAAPDTTPPSTPGNLSATPTSPTQINLNWKASNDDVGVAEYQVTRNGDLIATTTSTNYSNTNLTPGTLYSYAVIALDEVGNESSPAESSAATPPILDTIAPSVSLTSPDDGSEVQGMVVVSAVASDNMGVMGVQFQVNEKDLGPEDTTNDYATEWDTVGLEPGSYVITAIAQDAAGNSTTSAPMTVMIPEAPTTGTGFMQSSGSDGLLSVEVEHAQTNTPQGDHSWDLVTPSGHSSDGAMKAKPNNGTNNKKNSQFLNDSPRLDVLATFTKTGTHYVWIRGKGKSPDNSIHVGLNGKVVKTAKNMKGFKSAWTWSNKKGKTVGKIDISAANEQTISLWMREDGFVIDKIVLTTNPEYVPTGTGPKESPQGEEPPSEDTEAPSMPGNLSADVLSSTNIKLAWTPSTDNVGVGRYVVYRGDTPIGTTTTLMYEDNNLTPDTTYHYQVTAFDNAENESGAAATSASTDPIGDTQKPAVGITAPGNDSEVSGVVTVSATASDNVGVVGVQFHLNGENLGPEDTTNDYEATWDTTGMEPGTYSLTATARDAAGNIGTAQTVSVTIPEQSSLPLAVTNLSVDTTTYTYEVVDFGLQSGAMTWVDRDYTYASIPGFLQGMTYIKTAKGNKKSKNNDSYISFDVNQSVTVYVAHDPLITSKPSWMNSFTNSGEIFQTSDGYTLELYSKAFPTGTVNLGANHGVSGSNMYTVAIVAQGGGTPPPSDTTPPSTPGNFNASAQSSSQINLSWNASTDNEGIKEYQISRNGSLIATTSSTGYTDNGLTPDTDYNYSVVAMDDAKNSSSAATDSATTNEETTTPPSTGAATLSWNPNLEPDLAGYLAYIGTSSHNYTMTKDAGMTSNHSNPSFTVDDLTEGEMYYFAISAYDQNGNESPLSGEVEKMVK